MNLLAIFQALIAMGVCQSATLTDSQGQKVRAFVCPADPIINPPQKDDGHDPSGDVSPPRQPGQKRT